MSVEMDRYRIGQRYVGALTGISLRELSSRALEDEDFLRISADHKVHVEVPVVFANEEASPGLKRGGVLNIVRHELELVCAPDSIPDEIRIDVTGLEVGASIHISHVALPEGTASAITDRDFTIATIVAPSGLRSEEGDNSKSEAGA